MAYNGNVLMHNHVQRCRTNVQLSNEFMEQVIRTILYNDSCMNSTVLLDNRNTNSWLTRAPAKRRANSYVKCTTVTLLSREFLKLSRALRKSQECKNNEGVENTQLCGIVRNRATALQNLSYSQSQAVARLSFD